jgi:hypothetical protein
MKNTKHAKHARHLGAILTTFILQACTPNPSTTRALPQSALPFVIDGSAESNLQSYLSKPIIEGQLLSPSRVMIAGLHVSYGYESRDANGNLLKKYDGEHYALGQDNEAYFVKDGNYVKFEVFGYPLYIHALCLEKLKGGILIYDQTNEVFVKQQTDMK